MFPMIAQLSTVTWFIKQNFGRKLFPHFKLISYSNECNVNYRSIISILHSRVTTSRSLNRKIACTDVSKRGVWWEAR